MITEQYKEALAEALGYDFDIPSDSDFMWMFQIGELQFDFSVGVITKSEKSKTELRPYATIMCSLLYWESAEDVAEDVLIEFAKGNAFPFGLRLRDLNEGGVMLYLEYFSLLTLSVDQDVDSLKFLIGMMVGAAEDIQRLHA